MLPWLYTVSFVVETLAMKLGPLDKDGIDVIFTFGQDLYNLTRVKEYKGPEQIRRRIREAWPKEGQELKPTDMSKTLGDLYERYRKDRKAMTLIVITDGIWEGTTPPENVETEFVKFLKRKQFSSQKRMFTIQFVRFGNNKEAIEKLDLLDDGLEEKYKHAKDWYFE